MWMKVVIKQLNGDNCTPPPRKLKRMVSRGRFLIFDRSNLGLLLVSNEIDCTVYNKRFLVSIEL
jgi:hypothetical protein